MAYIRSIFGLSFTSVEPRWLQRGNLQCIAEISNIGKKKLAITCFGFLAYYHTLAQVFAALTTD
jgi:hypothetical protein